MSGNSELEETYEETYKRLQAASEKMDAWRAELGDAAVRRIEDAKLQSMFGPKAHYSDGEFEAMFDALREEILSRTDT